MPPRRRSRKCGNSKEDGTRCWPHRAPMTTAVWLQARPIIRVVRSLTNFKATRKRSQRFLPAIWSARLQDSPPIPREGHWVRWAKGCGPIGPCLCIEKVRSQSWHSIRWLRSILDCWSDQGPLSSREVCPRLPTQRISKRPATERWKPWA